MYPPVAATVRETPTSAATALTTVEVAIAALINEAGDNLRSHSDSDPCSIEQAASLPPASTASVENECPATQSNNSAGTVKGPCVQQLQQEVKIKPEDRISNLSSRPERLVPCFWGA